MPALVVLTVSVLLGACFAPGEPSGPERTAMPSAKAPSPEVSGAEGPGSGAPIVVAELFTSQDCSSCPPADRLLAALTREAEASGAALLTLSYHVDYWDRLGWTDPFGSARHSARQRAYAPTLDGRVYTPELVVGGTRAVVGSHEPRVRAALADAASDAQPVGVALAATARGGALGVDYAVTDAPHSARLHLLVVQREGGADVARGENGGRRLDHVHIVRGVETVAAGRGTTTLALPDGVGAHDVFVAALVQPGRVGAVLGAARVDVTPADTSS